MKKLLTLFFILQRAFAFAQPGSPDPTFGTNGLWITSPGNFGDQVNAIAIQNDQKIISAGFVKSSFTSSNFSLSRCYTNGSPDTSFGQGGLVLTTIESRSKVNAVAINTTGVLVAGGASDWHINLAQYNSNGSLDSTFGNGGTVITDVPGFYSETCQSIAVLSNGKILVAGFGKHNSNDNPYVLLLRYLPNGIPDSSFGVNGLVVGGEGMAHSMAIQSNGYIVLGGGSNLNMSSWRFLENGIPDNSYGTNGQVITSIGLSGEGYSIGIQPNGYILLAGYVYIDSLRSDMAVIRYDSNGVPDPMFGQAGITVTNVSNYSSIAYSLGIQSDGHIVLGGRLNNAFNWPDMALIRLNTSGNPDTGFGNNGMVVTPIGTSYSIGMTLKIQSDDKIVVGGYLYNGTKTDMVLARFNGNTGTGTEEFHREEDDILLYPNPFSSFTTICCEAKRYHSVDVKLFNSLGTEITCHMDRSGTIFYRDQLPDGVYFLQFRLQNKIITKKVIINTTN